MKIERSIDLICNVCQKETEEFKEIGESNHAMEKRIEIMKKWKRKVRNRKGN